MRLLSIDCSSAVTGWSIFEEQRLVAFGEIDLKKSKDKILDLYNAIREVIIRHRPTKGIIESTFLGPNVKTLKTLEQHRGVCILVMAQYQLEYHELGAAQVRKAVFGNGKIKKDEVAHLLSQHFNENLFTTGYDTSDSIALGCAYLGITIRP